jgi:hypothetical protein
VPRRATSRAIVAAIIDFPDPPFPITATLIAARLMRRAAARGVWVGFVDMLALAAFAAGAMLGASGGTAARRASRRPPP